MRFWENSCRRNMRKVVKNDTYCKKLLCYADRVRSSIFVGNNTTIMKYEFLYEQYFANEKTLDKYLAMSEEEMQKSKDEITQEYKNLKQRLTELELTARGYEVAKFLHSLNLRHGTKIRYKGREGVVGNVFNFYNERKIGLTMFLLKKDGSVGKTRWDIWTTQIPLIEII